MVVRSSDEKSLPPRCRAIPVGRIPAIILAPRRDRMELARIIIRKGDGMRDVERKIARGKRGGRKILHLANLYRIGRSEEHTSELQSLMRNSYAVFCLKKKTQNNEERT